MPYTINLQQIDSVLALPAAERYGHFIRRVADWEELWGLRAEDGWVTFGTDDGSKCLPFWPHPEYAQLLATAEWSGAAPERLELSKLMSWLPKMEKDGYLVAVFPTPAAKGIVVEPKQLLDHIAAECAQYE